MSTINQIDGHYNISFNKENGQPEFTEFGYYADGIPLEEVTKIVIEQNTILINQEFKNN